MCCPLLEEQLLHFSHGVIGAGHRLAGDQRVSEDFIVVASLQKRTVRCESVPQIPIFFSSFFSHQFASKSAYHEGLVTTEVNLGESFVLHMTEGVGLVPASREDVKGNLASNGVSESVVGELLPEGLNHLLADAVLLWQREWSGRKVNQMS